MYIATRLARLIVAVTGVTQVVLGVLFSTGHALGFARVHMIVGLVFVLALWTLAGLAARARVRTGLLVFTLARGGFS